MVKKIAFLPAFFLVLAAIGFFTAYAFQATSTDFSVCGNVGYLAGSGTSTDFGLVSYGNNDAVSMSTSSDFWVSPGIMGIFGCTPSRSPQMQSISLTVGSAVTLPGLSPGTPVTATTTVAVTTVGVPDGYTLEINRNSAGSTIATGTTPFPDYTPTWTPSSGSTCSGAGNATATPGQTFSFRIASSGTSADYCSAWWGINDAANALYAGMPTAPTAIVYSTSLQSQNGITTSTILYYANAPASQLAATYSGTVTVTVLANP
jgi:hypothetical protein